MRQCRVSSRYGKPSQPGFRDRSESDPPNTFQQQANPLRDTAPRLDEDVMTTSGEEASREAQNIVEKITPGETSVLRRRPAEKQAE